MSDERSFERFVADHVAGATGSARMPDDFYDDIFIWNTDAVTIPSGTGEISAVRQRIENEAGAWEDALTEIQVGWQFHEAAGWFTGEGAYDGLAAYLVSTASGEVWGVIKSDDGFGAPTAVAVE